MEKPLKRAWVGLQMGRWSRASQQITRVRPTVLASVDGIQIWCPPGDFEGGGLRKGTMTSAGTSFWEKVAPPKLTLQSDNSVPPCMSPYGIFRVAAPALGLRESESKSFKRNTWTPGTLNLTKPQFLLVLTDREVMGTAPPGTGTLGWGF